MRIIRFCALLLVFWLGSIFCSPESCDAATGQAMIEPHAQAMPLMPFLDYIIDPNIGMSIDEVVKMSGWAPLELEKLPMREGIVWLRFTIAPLAPDVRPQTFLLDMGSSLPGTPVLYEPFHNPLSGAQEWRSETASGRNIFLLPEASSEAVSYYISLQGLPGPWFEPMIRSPQDAASNWGSLANTGAILALAVVMALCLMRGLGERGEWRYWIALFVALALLQAWLGLPAIHDGFSIPNLAATLAPGLALMCLGHAGRHLLHNQSRAIDLQLFVLSLAGAALAILPLVAGFDWLNRWLDLWPLAIVIYIPTALGAWISGLEGAKRFLFACFIPPLVTAVSLLGLDFGFPANVLASGPDWGVAFAALLLAASPVTATGVRSSRPEKVEEKSLLPEIEMSSPEIDAVSEMDSDEREEVINLDHPLDDPNLRLLPPQRITMPDFSEPDQKVAPSRPEVARVPERVRPPDLPAINTKLEERENALREPLDELLREVAGLTSCSLPPSARQFAEKIERSARDLGTIMSSTGVEVAVEDRECEVFNLQHILRRAHDAVVPAAEYSGIALSWYMPPHLPQIYEGYATGLETTLAMLMESAVRSANKGAIKMAVRRVPDNPDPGNLLFTITDEGNGYPPLDRSSLALARAWELTGRHGGYFSVESSQHGTTISFTAHFEPVVEAQADAAKTIPYVTIVSEDQEKRRHLMRVLAPLSCQINEADSEPDTIALQEQKPATVLITQGRFARPAAADMIRRASKVARQSGIKWSALALTSSDNEWGLLKASGFTHAMLEPVDSEIFRLTVEELLEANTTGHGNSESIYSASTALTEPIKVDEKAPSMVIDQNFPITGVFEGPEWLGENLQLGETPAAPHTEGTGETEALHDETADSLFSAQGEIADAQRGERPLHAPLDAIEWVGEPMPIVAKGEQESIHDVDQKVKSELADGKEGIKEESDGGKARTGLNDFVEGSADLVASTFSEMLRKKETTSQPGAPIQARSDPAIVSLVDRLDVAMKHASAAFANKNAAGIAESTAMIAQDAENFGLRLLARMAKCVERAAGAGDMNALSDLLPELANAVERNRITLSQRKTH